MFRAGLLVGFLADGVFLQEGALAVYAVLGQFELRLVAAELGQQRLVVHLGQQVAFFDGGALPEIDRHDLARGLEREVHLFVGQQVTYGGDPVGQLLGAYDEPVDVQDARPARDDRGIGIGLGGSFAVHEVIEAQSQAEYHENNGRNDPFFLFVHIRE